MEAMKTEVRRKSSVYKLHAVMKQVFRETEQQHSMSTSLEDIFSTEQIRAENFTLQQVSDQTFYRHILNDTRLSGDFGEDSSS